MEHLFFIGNQLVALSNSGKIGVFSIISNNVLLQEIVPINCFDTAGSFLLLGKYYFALFKYLLSSKHDMTVCICCNCLGCTNGAISYIDMQKFPLRMKDNDLLVTTLYNDPSCDPITAISVYLTPKTSLCGNWIEIAYGTQSGMVRVIVQHPETVGHGPQLFQTFTVSKILIFRFSSLCLYVLLYLSIKLVNIVFIFRFTAHL